MENIKVIRNRALRTLGNMHTTERIAMCLGYNIGDLVKAIYRITWCVSASRLRGSGQERSADAWRAEARLAAADCSLQLRLLVNELGFEWDDVIDLGERHHKEVMEQVARGERD